MGFRFHCRKLLHQNNEYTIPRGSTSYSPAPSPSPHQYDPSLSLHNPFSPKLPLFPIIPVHDDDWLHTHLLQLAMIVVACTLGFVMLFCTISLIRRHYYYSRRRNHMRGNTPILFYVNGDSPVSASDGDDDDGPIIDHPIWLIRTEGLQQSVIDSITVFVYRKDEGLIDGTECSVCLGEFQDDENLRLLPKCSHAFHIPCIDTWLRSHKNCPLCRAPVVHDAAEVRRVAVADSSASVENQDIISTQMENHQLGESEIRALRNGDDDGDGDDAGVLSSEDGGSEETLDKVLPIFDKMNCDSAVMMIGSHEESEEEIQPMRRSVSMDLSSAASVMFHDVVVDLSCDQDSLETQLGDTDRINSKGKDMKVEKQSSGCSSSTAICKLASIGRVLQKRPISLRSSFSSSSSSSQNRKSLSSRHCRSQSSTFPL